MKVKVIELTDAQEMQRKHPNTFEAPKRDALLNLSPGMYVKICPIKGAERFWCKIISIIDLDSLIGEVNNFLFDSEEHGLYLGDKVLIHLNEIYSIYLTREKIIMKNS